MNYNIDERLSNLEDGQYRLWHDGQQILVPKGKSITQPKCSELVQTNARVYGKINKGYFNKPTVDFTNTNVDTERFDIFQLQTWRNEDQLPIDENIDLNKDLGITELHAFISTTFQTDIYLGFNKQDVILKHYENNTWRSEDLLFLDNMDEHLEGNFYYVINPTEYDYQRGVVVDINTTLLNNNHKLYVVVTKAQIFSGNSQAKLILQNADYTINCINNNCDILGGV